MVEEEAQKESGQKLGPFRGALPKERASNDGSQLCRSSSVD